MENPVLVGKIPVALRIPTDPHCCAEEKAIIDFVNGDTNIHQLMASADDIYIGTPAK